MNVLLLLLGAFVLIVCLCFLAFTGYVYHVHNKYSHIPTPKYSRLVQPACLYIDISTLVWEN